MNRELKLIGAAQIFAAEHLLDLPVEPQRGLLLQGEVIGLAVLLEELIGVFARRQMQDPQFQLPLKSLQFHFANGALGSTHTGSIGVEIEDDPPAFAAAAELGDLLGAHGRAQSRHRMAHSSGMQSNHIEIALHHQGAVRTADGISGFIEAVEVFTLVKHLRFRRVEVFGLAAIKAAAAEANDSALTVVNRHHQPMAETVVKAIAPFAGHHQASRFHQAGINALHLLEMAQQPIPRFWGIAQFKGFDRAGAQPPLLGEVVECCGPFRGLQA